MAQYGSLTTAEQATFDSYVVARNREPKTVLWLANQGEVDDYFLYASTYRALESGRGLGFIGIGRAVIVLSNEDGAFYNNGVSQIEKNDRVKIWSGFGSLVIPVFTGIVTSVQPNFVSNTVVVYCADYMHLFWQAEVYGSMGTNNTPKLILENFCSTVNVTSNIPSRTELTTAYDDPYFDRQSMLHAAQKVQNTVFSVLWFDEAGVLQIAEREYRNPVDFTFTDDNSVLETMLPTQVINKHRIEYADFFLTEASDQTSIDTYGERTTTKYNTLFNHEAVAEKTHGWSERELDYDLSAFKITTSATAAVIDAMHIAMRQSGASGYMTAKVYSESSGVPGTLLGTSQLKATATIDTDFIWEVFYFSDPVSVSPSTNYWIVLDTSSVTGTVYVRGSGAAATALYAYYSGGAWVTVNNIQPCFKARSSQEAYRVAADVVRFGKEPHERVRITAPAVPHLQMLDEVDVDMDLDSGSIIGKYTVEGIEQVMTPARYQTVHTLRKTG